MTIYNLNIPRYVDPCTLYYQCYSEEVGHSPKRLMEVKIDQSETRKLR